MGLSKLHYNNPGEQLEEVLLFEKDALFCPSLTLKEKLSPFFEFYSMQLSELHFKCPEDHLCGKFSFWETIFFHQFWRLALTFQRICWSFLGRVITTAPVVSKQTVWDNRFSQKNLFCRSENSRVKSSTFCRKKSDGLSTLLFTSPVEHSQENCFFLKTATFW